MEPLEKKKKKHVFVPHKTFPAILRGNSAVVRCFQRDVVQNETNQTVWESTYLIQIDELSLEKWQFSPVMLRRYISLRFPVLLYERFWQLMMRKNPKVTFFHKHPGCNPEKKCCFERFHLGNLPAGKLT